MAASRSRSSLRSRPGALVNQTFSWQRAVVRVQECERARRGGARTAASPPAKMLVPVVVRLVRPFFRNPEIRGLLVRQLRESCPDLVEVQPRDLLVEMLGQHVHLLLVAPGVLCELDLRDHLV